jgi:hypothetical protein
VLRNLLVIGQVSLSMGVLVSAGLFLHSLRQMQTVALGFRTDRLLMMSVDLGLQQYDDVRGRRFLDTLLARTEALPGVASATTTVHVPLDYGMQFADITVDGVTSGTLETAISPSPTPSLVHGSSRRRVVCSPAAAASMPPMTSVHGKSRW